MIGIYRITSPTFKIYIGQSIDIERRWIEHKRSKANNRLSSSFKSHGFESHIFEILEECRIEDLNERERFYQDFYDTLGPNGLNLRLTESSDKSGCVSQETKDKLVEYHKNRSLEDKRKTVERCLDTKSRETELQRSIRLKKLSKARQSRVTLDETRRKISIANKDKVFSQEHRDKISESNKRKVVSKESVEKMKATKNKIDSITGLTNAQMSTSKNIGRKQTQDSRDKFKQTILNKQLKKKLC